MGDDRLSEVDYDEAEDERKKSQIDHIEIVPFHIRLLAPE